MRGAPVAVLFEIPPALTPFGQRIKLIEKFTVVFEIIHLIKKHWHYLNLAVLVACLRSWQFHVLDVVGGEKVITHQAQENVHPLQFGPDLFVPAVAGFEFCVVPRLKSIDVSLYFQHGT
jgi:hypothetical protein